jgi:hypothetical protein
MSLGGSGLSASRTYASAAAYPIRRRRMRSAVPFGIAVTDEQPKSTSA